MTSSSPSSLRPPQQQQPSIGVSVKLEEAPNSSSSSSLSAKSTAMPTLLLSVHDMRAARLRSGAFACVSLDRNAIVDIGSGNDSGGSGGGSGKNSGGGSRSDDIKTTRTGGVVVVCCTVWPSAEQRKG
jgi:hypothetical protein